MSIQHRTFAIPRNFNLMRRILFVSLFIFSCLTSFSQQPAGGQRDSARFKAMMKDSSFMKNMAPTGKVIGLLRDSSNREPLAYASIALIKVRDSSVAGGALTDEKGVFRIEDVMPGRYVIRITSIGYRQLDSKPFMLTPQEPLKDFGNVWMPPSQKILKEAEIVGEKAEYVNSLDKKVYNVDKTLVNAGGSVSEVLQNIPSVNVDIDGKISLRGSEQVTVLIDGKPSGLTGDNRGAILQQLPASSIDQIEVITNPSSKYDAEGMSGIINIKTKKDKNIGLNGTVTVGAGTNDKYNAGLQLNRRSKKSNIFFNYGFRDDRRYNEGNSLRTNTYGDAVSYFRSLSDGTNDNLSHNFRSGIDIFLNDYNTLGFSGSYNARSENRRELSVTTVENEVNQVVSGFDRLSKTKEENSNIDGSIDYKKTYRNSKKELTANINLTRINRDNENSLYTFLTTDDDLNQRIFTGGVSYNGTAQVDYILPKEKYKVEMGVKSSLRNNDNEQRSDRFDFTNSSWNEDVSFADQFILTEWVYAGYLQWTGRWKVFDLSAGLRAEQTFITGDSKSADTTFTRDFANLFPSAAVKYGLKEGHDVQLSYSRRINRPREGQLNPFRNVSDSLNVQVGNPSIMPELTHSLEFGYTGRYGEQNVSANVFYRYTDDFSQRYRTVDTVTNISTMTFVNYSTAENLGLELVFRNTIYKIINTSLSLTAFYNAVDGTNVGSDLVSDVWSGDVRGSVAVKLGKQFSFQFTGNYMAPREQPQGTFRGMSGVDFGFKYDFKGGKWTLNGSITDIFDTRNFDIDNRGEGFRLEAVRKRESRVASFTLSYRFGKTDLNQRNRRQSTRPADSQQNDMMDF